MHCARQSSTCSRAGKIQASRWTQAPRDDALANTALAGKKCSKTAESLFSDFFARVRGGGEGGCERQGRGDVVMIATPTEPAAW